MIKRILLVVLALMLAVVSLLAACAEPAPAPVKLRLTCGLPVGHNLSEVAKVFKQEVEAATNGVVTVELYLGGELFKHSDVPRVLPVGGVEMAISHGGHLEGLTPIASAFSHPFSVTTPEEFAKARDTLLAIFDEQLNKSNIKVLTPLDYGRGAFSCRHHLIKSPADIEGLKIRAPTSAYLKAIEQWGGIPATLAAAEVYDALGKGAIDGALVGWSTFGSRAYYEVADYYSGHTSSSSWWLIMNLDTWNGLDGDTQKAITEAALKAEKTSHTLGTEGDKKWQKMILDAGCTIYIFTPEELEVWKTATRPIYDEWIEICKEAGVGDEAIQIMRAAEIPGF